MKTDDIVYFGGVVTDTGYVTTAGGPWCRVARVRSTETVASDIEVFQGATREGTLVRKAIRIGSPTAVYRRSEEDFIVEDDVYRALARFRYVGGVWLLVCELPGLNLCATPQRPLAIHTRSAEHGPTEAPSSGAGPRRHAQGLPRSSKVRRGRKRLAPRRGHAQPRPGRVQSVYEAGTGEL